MSQSNWKHVEAVKLDLFKAKNTVILNNYVNDSEYIEVFDKEKYFHVAYSYFICLLRRM